MIKDVQLRVVPEVAATESKYKEAAARELGLNAHQIQGVRIVRRSIDARQRQIMVNLTVRCWADEPMSEQAFQCIDYPDVENRQQVIVVGAGPGGLFAALRLIELGLRPIVVERGKNVHDRKKDIARISREHLHRLQFSPMPIPILAPIDCRASLRIYVIRFSAVAAKFTSRRR